MAKGQRKLRKEFRANERRIKKMYRMQMEQSQPEEPLKERHESRIKHQEELLQQIQEKQSHQEELLQQMQEQQTYQGDELKRIKEKQEQQGENLLPSMQEEQKQPSSLFNILEKLDFEKMMNIGILLSGLYGDKEEESEGLREVFKNSKLQRLLDFPGILDLDPEKVAKVAGFLRELYKSEKEAEE